MKLFSLDWRGWGKDRALGGVIRNTGYLFSSNTISMGLTALQGVVAAFLLGPADYGMLGMVILFTSSVNRLLSFRMGELVIRYAGQDLAVGQRDRAAAVIKVAGLTEGVTSIAAYVLLVLLAPLAARVIIKEPGASSMIIYYGVALLANLVTETSMAVLQVGSHYRSQAALNLVQSALSFLWVLGAFVFHGGINAVLSAYLAGKLVFGLGVMVLALRWMKPLLGEGWTRAPLSLLPNRREIARFAVSTNLSGTINMVIRDSEVLWAGFFFTRLDAGYYKFALALMNIIMMPITPFITTTFPEISKLVAKLEFPRLRLLLRRTTLIALVWTVGCGIGLLLLGPWFLGWFKEGAYAPSFTAMMVLLLGYGTANILFWNRPLLLALDKPNYPLVVTALVGVAKTALMFALVRQFGIVAQSAILSGYLLLSVGLVVQRGLRELKHAETSAARGEVA